MIYILFIISLTVYLFFKTGQAYYEYFDLTRSSIGDKNHQQRKKNIFLWTPKMLVWSFLKSRKPNWTIKGNKSVERKLSIIKGLSHFIFIFCIVSFIFCVLQLWLDISTQVNFAKATILKIEETQFKIKDFVSHFKIGFAYDFLIVIVLIALSSSFSIIEKDKIKDKIKRYNKVIKSILYFLTISTSFTFFGNRFASEEEGRIGKLETHKLQIFEGNKLLLKKINDVITDRVVSEIISNPEMQKALDDIDEIKKNIEYAKQDLDYKYFISVVAKNVASNLPIINFEKNYNNKFDFNNGFGKAESKFENEYRRNTKTQSDFYQAKRESDYNDFKEKNQSWFNEKEYTESSEKQAEETFTKAFETSSSKYSKYYSKYKEPIEKLVKKAYSSTAGEWIKDFFQTLGVDLPFLDELIDPIINEPVQDYITKKTEIIFNSCFKNRTEDVVVELANCSSEFKRSFNDKVSSSQKFAKLKEQILADLNSSKEISFVTKTQVQIQIRSSDDYLLSMSSQSRWERIRQDFLSRVNEDYDLNEFSIQQKDNFKEVLNDWNAYKQKNKLNWYFNSAKNIENEFFLYSKNDGNIKATWGFILQQEDWDGAVAYYTNPLHYDGAATGKPYYLLKYYYNTTDKGEQFSSLYDNETESGVGIMCPH